MNGIDRVRVGLDFGLGPIPVGQLAARDHRLYFSYEEAFIEQGLELSPFTLPLKTGVFTFDDTPFDGLPGLFGDSLPDGWGRLLADRFFASRSLSPTPLDRLSLVGTNGPGALIYTPTMQLNPKSTLLDLDDIAYHTQAILQGKPSDVFEELLHLNASSAGARPKIIINLSADLNIIEEEGEGEAWLIKFASNYDTIDCGAIEYVYSLLAERAHLPMSQTHLFAGRRGPGYFGTKRFDRIKGERLHMQSASALLSAEYRIPALDYKDLLTLTLALTHDVREVERMYRIAVFNVLAYNRDDHARNFSFLMDRDGTWSTAPAYDLTFSHGPGGEQSTMVMGEGRNPTTEHLLALGQAASIPQPLAKHIIEETKEALSHWTELASEYGVSGERTAEIAKQLNR